MAVAFAKISTFPHWKTKTAKIELLEKGQILINGLIRGTLHQTSIPAFLAQKYLIFFIISAFIFRAGDFSFSNIQVAETHLYSILFASSLVFTIAKNGQESNYSFFAFAIVAIFFVILFSYLGRVIMIGYIIKYTALYFVLFSLVIDIKIKVGKQMYKIKNSDGDVLGYMHSYKINKTQEEQ